MVQQVRRGSGPPKCRGFTFTLRHTTLGMTSLDEWSAQRRNFYFTTRNTRNTDIRASGGIGTRNPSKWAAADPCLKIARQPGPAHWLILYLINYSTVNFNRLRILTGFWTVKSLICYPPLKQTKLKQCIALTLYSRKSDSPNLGKAVSHHVTTMNTLHFP